MSAGRAREARGVACAGKASLTLALAGLFAIGSSATAADQTAGRAKAAACVACHGEAGISVQPDAPNLAGQPAIYLAAQLRQFRSGRRQSEVMAVIAKPLSDQDIDDLAAWYASIDVQAKAPR